MNSTQDRKYRMKVAKMKMMGYLLFHYNTFIINDKILHAPSSGSCSTCISRCFVERVRFALAFKLKMNNDP